ncbi:ABC transporter permease, partial [Acidobacteriota bacterium]
MFKNYLKVSLRNIVRHKGYSLINVASLSIGMTCCILMLLWVQDEISYDRFHKNADEIYRVVRETKIGGKKDHYSAAPNPTAPLLKERYPEVIDAVRFRGGYTDWLVQYGEKSFLNDRLGVAGPSFFRVFKFPFVKGDPNTALDHRQSVVLSESTAKKYFGREEPMDKVMKINTRDFKVTGIIKDVPHNSHMQFDLVVPVINAHEWWGENPDDWNRDFELHTYILLDKNSSPEGLNQKIAGIVKEHRPTSDTRLYLQPLKDIYLYSSHLKYDNVGLGSITYVYIFSLIAFCILLIGCINFMNLSTARSGIRAKEIGMRKICGAHRTAIMKQFFAESVIFSFIALLFAVLLVYLSLPAFNNLSGKQLTLFGGTGNLILILELAVITFLTGMIAGSYPSLFLSSFQPVNVLKGISRGGKLRGAYLRKLLVVLQFTFMVVLIFGLIIIYNQLNFLKNKDLGFNKENILYFWGQGNFVNQIDAVKNELLQNPDIIAVSKSTPPIVELMTTTDVDWEGRKPGESAAMSP